MAVYMIRAGANGPVKIGFGTNATRRVDELQTGHAETLTVLRLIDGDRAFESALHRHFAPLRLRGEWFAYADEMLGDLEFLRPSSKESLTPAIMGNGRMDAALRHAVTAAGGIASLAQRLGIKAPSIYSWRRVPTLRGIAVEAATGIPRHVLRPDIWDISDTPSRFRMTPPPLTESVT
jgi:hypothetical protein